MLKQSFTYVGGGAQVTSGASSALHALPTTGDGSKARYVALVCPSGYCYAKPALAAGSATVNDFPVVAGMPPLVLSVQQFTQIAYIQGSAGALLNILPLEY
jgi:hypothetical protein